MRLMASFFRAYPGRTSLMLLALLLSGVAEGVGLSALLPLLNVALGYDVAGGLAGAPSEGQNQFEQTVSRVYVSGGVVMFSGIVEALAEVFELETNRFMPFETLDVTAADDVILHEKASDMVVALGLASRIRSVA